MRGLTNKYSPHWVGCEGKKSYGEDIEVADLTFIFGRFDAYCHHLERSSDEFRFLDNTEIHCR